MASTADLPLHRQLQLHPSLYCLMATDDQAATVLHLVADAIEHEGLSSQTVEWLRWQARAAYGVQPATKPMHPQSDGAALSQQEGRP